jgi:hypothetical protein
MSAPVGTNNAGNEAERTEQMADEDGEDLPWDGTNGRALIEIARQTLALPNAKAWAEIPQGSICQGDSPPVGACCLGSPQGPRMRTSHRTAVQGSRRPTGKSRSRHGREYHNTTRILTAHGGANWAASLPRSRSSRRL